MPLLVRVAIAAGGQRQTWGGARPELDADAFLRALSTRAPPAGAWEWSLHVEVEADDGVRDEVHVQLPWRRAATLRQVLVDGLLARAGDLDGEPVHRLAARRRAVQLGATPRDPRVELPANGIDRTEAARSMTLMREARGRQA